MADGFLPPVVAVLTANIADFQAKMATAKGEMEGVEGTAAGMSTLGKAAFLGLAAAVGTVGYESVKMATNFQTQMTRLYTAAGAPKQAVLDSSNAILQLGTSVGQTGTAMAEALYHPISAGLDLATSLQVVKYAAEETAISGANLDDTTYSLSSVMKAFNMPADQAAQAMADLNAIVGEGDMRFQDFNQSIKNWAPTAAQMGISVNSMGAGLAYLTDRGNSAEVASTRMTMGISMMTTPTKQAATLLEGLGVASSDVSASSQAMTQVLQKTGITQNKLALDLKQPDGLYVALKDLRDGLEKAGISGTEADSVLSKIFGGGRSDKAIMSLMQNLDGLKQKYDAISNDSTPQKFAQNWADAQKTFGFEMQKLGAFFENLGIKIGSVLLPVLAKLADWFMNSVTWLGQHKDVLMAIASVAIPFLVAGVGKLVKSVVTGFETISKVFMSNPWALLIAAVIFLAYEIITHWDQIKKFLAPLANWFNQNVIQPIVKVFKEFWAQIKPSVDAVVKFIKDAWKTVSDWTKQHWDQIKQVLDTVWKVIGSLIHAYLDSVVSDIKFGWQIIGDVFHTALRIIGDVINGIVDWFKGLLREANGVIEFFTGLFTGNWQQVWQGIKDIFGGAIDQIKAILGTIVNVGRDLVEGLWNGISAMGGWIWSQITGWANGILNSIKAAFGISSPSKETYEHGRFLAEGLAAGLDDHAHIAAAAASRMASSVLGAANPGGLGLTGSAGSLAMAPAGTGGTVVIVNVAGSVLAERDLQRQIQEFTLRYNMRNSGNGLSLGVA